MTDEPKILRARSEHAPEILRLLSVQLREHSVNITDSSLKFAVEGVLADSGRGFFLVLELNQSIVGVAYISYIWALEHGGQSAWLEELYIDPNYREHGLGALLLQAAITECKSSDCSALDLEIDINHERVRTLYDRHGFASLPRSRLVKKLQGKP